MNAQVLAARLILALLLDDVDEMAYHVWAIRDESGLTEPQFALAFEVAREAAGWWRTGGVPKEGRNLLLCRISELTTTG